jgi:glycerol-3-phosphate acyltransferase PlsX
VFSGKVDVVVCDGFTGNLVLKITEGVAETLVSFLKESIRGSVISKLAALALIPCFNRVKRRMDYAEQGGAPLLGLRGVPIICHGGSNSKAIKNAILGAGRYADCDLPGVIERSIGNHPELLEAAKGRRKGEAGYETETVQPPASQNGPSNEPNIRSESGP